MKLKDIAFGLPEEDHAAGSFLHGPERPILPGDTVDRHFSVRARETPDAIAVVDEAGSYSYRDLDRAANRIAAFLAAQGIEPGAAVAVLLERSFHLVAAMMGIMRSGCCYVPINPAFPEKRMVSVLQLSRASVLIFGARSMTKARLLQWRCPSIGFILCPDSRDLNGISETSGARMSEALWDHVARCGEDEIAAGGWRSRLSGRHLGRSVMDDYAANIRGKLIPYLNPSARVLEIGCASGITMFSLCDLAGDYLATDLSGEMIARCRLEAGRRGLRNVRFARCAAHEIDRLHERDFHAVILNSVVQSFSGYGYLHQVLRRVIDLCAGEAVVFLGHLWDAALRDQYRPEAPAAGEAVSEPDWEDALFLDRDHVRDLRHDFTEIAAVDLSEIRAREANELTRFGYDAVLHIRKNGGAPKPEPRRHPCFDARDLARFAQADPVHAARPELPAYAIFTSGSTGEPKGVAIPMRSLVNLCHWYGDFCEMSARDRVFQIIASSFDASVKNYAAPLMRGARIVILPEGPFDPREMLDMLERTGATVLNPGVPSQIYPMVDLAARDHYRPLRSLRVLALGGEKPDLARLRDWFESGRCRLEWLANIYGPTECTDISLAGKWRTEDALAMASIPIGTPIDNVRCCVMNEAGVPQPPGVAGELCISGIGVAPGYLGRPDLTAERFVRDLFVRPEAGDLRLEEMRLEDESSFSRFKGKDARPEEENSPKASSQASSLRSQASNRLYRTGDLARLRRDGQLELLGRLDDEVKIRGHRLTLGEIEAHLGRISGISEAAVVCAPGPDRQPRLTAYLCGENVPAASRIRAVLAETLPAALIPVHFQRVESLPRNAHGKLDRSRLSGAFVPPSRTGEENAGPRNAGEAMLLGIWREVLGVGNMGIHEDFFDAGGHSMALVQLAAAMEAAVGREIPLALLFNARTIASQAELIRGLDSVAATDSRCRLLNAPGGRPVFCLPPISGLGLVFAPLARRLGGVSLHAFDFLCESDRIERYADAICRLAGETPPLLCGYSAGGNLAFAVARALEGRGRSPAGLVLIDSEPRREPVRTKVEDIVAAAARLFDGDQDLPDKVLDRIRAYARAHADGLDAGTIAAPIQLVLSRSMRTDPSDAWRARTTASVSAHAAAGTHDDILSELHISENLPLFQRLFGD
jgi:amino acid adenylation domain-containing protein